MNVHVPQSLQTQEELKQLCAVSTQIISPSKISPIISVIQDIATGLYVLTKNNVRLSEKQLFDLMSLNPRFNIPIPPPAYEEGKVQKWSGHQLLSTIIPEKVNMDMKKDGGPVVIKNGECLSGKFSKDIFQAQSTGVVHQVYNEYGSGATRELFDDVQKLICNWLIYNGFSVGISDMIVDEATKKIFQDIIQNMKKQAYEKLNEVHTGRFENKTIKTNHELFEQQVNAILNKTVETIGKVGLDNIEDSDNRMMNMINSKSKGNPMNLAQLMGCVGQQNVDGKRIGYSFDNRTLPHFTQFDDSPEAHGFVENSFVAGLNPQEFFFHAMGGREGLIDTAVSSVTGDTPIIIIENGKGKHVPIGEWIDKHIEENEDKVKHIPTNNMEYLKFDPEKTKVYIPTCDDYGKTSWGEMTAVTRHDVINGIYEMKTESGREVKVTGSKSMLIYRDGKLTEEYSANVKEGDLVPINCSLTAENMTSHKYIDMEEYFPKNEYLYGTEFHKAEKAMREAMNAPIVSDNAKCREAKRTRIRIGWWEESNGKIFQVPFPSKARLQRMTVRSNTKNIIDGAIYPFHAKRDASQFPDKLELNFENGAFIGLYIADGHSDPHSGQIGISKENDSILKWVQNWCSKYNINTKIIKQKKNGGISTTIFLYSTILQRFMPKIVGDGCEYKYFPKFAYTAPIEFVKGLISGYISGDGHISSSGDIEVGSVSMKVIDDLTLLLSRVGVMGMRSIKKSKNKSDKSLNILDMYNYRISAHWASVFRKHIKLIHTEKNEKLLNHDMSKKISRESKVMNDVFLDRITYMKKLEDDSIYPKVYDVTVPSTLNFYLGNGLFTKDTSETGYLQRKLIKAMEDCKVNYDGTVRNAGGNIIQFVYGEDGMDSVKLEGQKLPYITKNPDEIITMLGFSPEFEEMRGYLPEDERKKWAKDEHMKKRLAQHVQKILQDRDFVVVNMFQGEKEDKVIYPVHFERILTIASNTQNKFGAPPMTDLTPDHVLDKIKEIEDLKVTQMQPANTMLGILARFHMNPKKVILQYRLTKDVFDLTVEQIKLRFHESLINPCEMVGVIAAQSIGEPATQLTLNSVEWNTEIMIDNNGKFERHKIGEMIDNLIEKNGISSDKIEKHPNDTLLGWTKDKNMYIMSCDENGKESWKQIEAVTRHPVVNEDGSNTLIKVTLDSGREVIATKGKSFLTRIDNKIKPINGSELKVGDYLPISNTLPKPLHIVNEWDISAYLPKDKFLYMSEVKKALDVREEVKKSQKYNTPWFKPNQGKLFTLPYTRSDAFSEAFLGSNRCPTGKRLNIIKNNDNCVYPKSVGKQPAHIPEKIAMDELFGFFIGAYLAEGHCTKYHILIANIDDDFNNRIDEFCKRYNIKYHIDDALKNNGRSKTLRLHCYVLAQAIINSMGSGSANKRIPAEFIFANDEFVLGLLDGYLSGDGHISGKYNIIVSSISRSLLNDITNILSRFGIQSSIKIEYRSQEYDIERGLNAKLGYTLTIPSFYSKKLAKIMNLTLKEKDIKLKTIDNNSNRCRGDVIPNVKTTKGIIPSIYRTDIKNYMVKSKYEKDREVFENILQEDILYDRVKNIEEVENKYPWVYDLTIQDTRTFIDGMGISLFDTFHSSGISAVSNAVRGVPRLKEILDMSTKIRSPIMKVRFQEHIRRDKSLCLQVIHDMETIRFKDIVKSLRIYFDPHDFNTNIPEDRPLIDLYREFNLGADENMPNVSPWLLRLEFDRDKINDNNLDILKIHHSLDKFYQDRIFCISSDDNADQIVMRIKLTLDQENIEPDDILTELRALEYNIMENHVIRGIKNIEKVALDEQKKDLWNPITKTFDTNRHEWFAYTEGSNLLDVLSMDTVDPYMTDCNDIHEIYNVLGIEAARTVMYKEIMEVMGTMSINYRHIALLIDVMTNKGNIQSVNRHGINRGDIGPLAKCSFEETTDKLIKAGLFSEYDKINGVAANVMLGQVPPAGTGDPQVFLDESMIPMMKPHPKLNTIPEEKQEDSEYTQEEKDIMQEKLFDKPIALGSISEVKDVEKKAEDVITFV